MGIDRERIPEDAAAGPVAATATVEVSLNQLFVFDSGSSGRQLVPPQLVFGEVVRRKGSKSHSRRFADEFVMVAISATLRAGRTRARCFKIIAHRCGGAGALSRRGRMGGPRQPRQPLVRTLELRVGPEASRPRTGMAPTRALWAFCGAAAQIAAEAQPFAICVMTDAMAKALRHDPGSVFAFTFAGFAAILTATFATAALTFAAARA